MIAWTLDEINEHLHRQIVSAAGEIWDRAAADGISQRLAAHAVAVERVAEAARVRGLCP